VTAGFDDFFDAWAAAFHRDDGVIVGAHAEPTVLLGPRATVVCATPRELLDALSGWRRTLADRGVHALTWSSLEARPAGPGQHLVTVGWDHGDELTYVLRGDPPDALIVAIIGGS